MTEMSSWDISQSTIAVVIQPPASPPGIEDSDLRSIMRPPFSIGQGLAGEAFVSSTRDQMEIILSPTKINVRDLSGRNAFGDSKVPEILHLLVQKYDTTIDSFGINFIFQIPNSDPQGWIRKILLNPGIQEASGLALLGGQARISLQNNRKTWNISFQQAQDNSGIEVNFNASENTRELPAPDALRQSMDEQLRGLSELISKLDSIEVA